MKKQIARTLAILMLAAAMAGCAKAPTSSAPDNVPSADTKPTAAATDAKTDEAQSDEAKTDGGSADDAKYAEYMPDPDKKYTISWLALTNSPLKEDALLEKHWEEKFNIDLDIMAFDQSTFSEQLNLQLASGNIPDVIGDGDFNELARQGVLAELDADVVRHFMPNTIAELEVEFPGAMEYGFVDGVQYGFPRTIFMYNELRRPLIYNGLWLEKLGLAVPQTQAEFENVMTQFAKNDPDGNGKNDTYGLSRESLPFVYGMSGYDRGIFCDRDGKAVYSSIQPEIKESLTLLNKWYKDGILDPEFITGENTGGYWALSHAFINERIGATGIGAFYHWNPAMPGRVEGQNYTEIVKRKPEMAEKLTFGPAPTGTTSGKGGVSMGSTVTGAYFTLGEQLEQEKDKMGKILEMCEFLFGSFNEDSYITYMHGLKGTMWDYGEDGGVQQIGKYVDTKEIQSEGGWGIMHKICLSKNQKLVEGKLMDWGYDKGLDQGIYRNIVPACVTFEANTQYKTELDKIENEAYIAMITGEKPIDYFDTFVKEWLEAGGEELTQEVDAWYQTNKN